ncbi:hypothetical protein ACP4OV_027935 [Aristida adscensionis]
MDREEEHAMLEELRESLLLACKYVPEEEHELSERIAWILRATERISNAPLAVENLYHKYVLSKIDSASSEKDVLSIGQYTVNEADFVDCFKPLREMDPRVFDAQCYLWNQEWNDKVILNLDVTEALKTGDTVLLVDVLVATTLEHINVIFMPFMESDSWCLIIVEHDKSGQIFYPNSSTDITLVSMQLYQEPLKILMQMGWLGKADGFRGLVPSEVLCPKNKNHFGFLVLSWIPDYQEIDWTEEVAEEIIFMFRKKLAVDLINSPVNKCRPNEEVHKRPMEQPIFDLINSALRNEPLSESLDDMEQIYNEKILAEEQREVVAVKIIDHVDYPVGEPQLMSSLKPGGWLDSCVVDLLGRLWMEKRDDILILANHASACLVSGSDGRSLDHELKD